MSGPNRDTLRSLAIDSVYRLSVDQWPNDPAPTMWVFGCDCAAQVETPEKAREMAAFLTAWADEQEADRG